MHAWMATFAMRVLSQSLEPRVAQLATIVPMEIQLSAQMALFLM